MDESTEVSADGDIKQRSVGRPTLYTPELAEEILNWLADGKFLRVFCRLPGKPCWRTVYNWMDADPEFSARIARARGMGHDAIAEDTIEISDTPQEGVTVTTDEDGKTKEVREDMLGHRKLQVETRLKLLAKWSPKKYGDLIRQEVSGPDGGPVKTTSISPEQAAQDYLGIVKGDS